MPYTRLDSFSFCATIVLHLKKNNVDITLQGPPMRVKVQSGNDSMALTQRLIKLLRACRDRAQAPEQSNIVLMSLLLVVEVHILTIQLIILMFVCHLGIILFKQLIHTVMDGMVAHTL